MDIPSWLDRLFSQVNAFNDIREPQVFTHRDFAPADREATQKKTSDNNFIRSKSCDQKQDCRMQQKDELHTANVFWSFPDPLSPKQNMRNSLDNMATISCTNISKPNLLPQPADNVKSSKPFDKIKIKPRRRSLHSSPACKIKANTINTCVTDKSMNMKNSWPSLQKSINMFHSTEDVISTSTEELPDPSQPWPSLQPLKENICLDPRIVKSSNKVGQETNIRRTLLSKKKIITYPLPSKLPSQIDAQKYLQNQLERNQINCESYHAHSSVNASTSGLDEGANQSFLSLSTSFHDLPPVGHSHSNLLIHSRDLPAKVPHNLVNCDPQTPRVPNNKQTSDGTELINDSPETLKLNHNMRGTPMNKMTLKGDYVANPFTPSFIDLSDHDVPCAKLRSVEEIPVAYRGIFSFPFFNAVQSLALDQLLYTDTSVVVSAPTGCGKTALFELAMVRQILHAHQSQESVRMVYIAPMKALCSERAADWQQKLSSLGLQCVELTGDSEIPNFNTVLCANLICTTPEKWDSVTRRWKDNRSLFTNICLLCIDEVHVIGDLSRGATLEAVITRMKLVQTLATGSNNQAVRIVAVSSTLPNTDDIGEWLGSEDSPASVFRLGEKYRPVKLRRIVLGFPFPEGSSEFSFDLKLTYKLRPIIDMYCEGKPTLVFCASRKSVTHTAEILAKQRWGNTVYFKPQHKQEVQALANMMLDKKLSWLLTNGVGIHHAGMGSQDRKLVEELFRGGRLPVLSVNLPAHLVIVKATHTYIMGMAHECSDLQLLQMMGRAGRPQFDTSATVVIMTKTQLKTKYEALFSGTQLIESMLHKSLVEHLNAEVVLQTIANIGDAVAWLSNTFLNVRISKNPGHYGMPFGMNNIQMEKRLQDLCITAINRLASLDLVSINPDTTQISTTDRGQLMACYCLAFETLKLLSEMPSQASLEQVVNVVASCPEFDDIQLRMNDKKTLNALNKNKTQETIRFPLKGKIKTKQMKVSCLLQAGLGCLPVPDFALSQDLMKIFRVGQRITKCLMELKWLEADFLSLINTTLLSKAFKSHLWHDSKHVVRQIDGIGPSLSQALVKAGFTSFESLEAASPQHIEMVVNRHPPFGHRILDAVAHLPRYQLTIQQEKQYQSKEARLLVTISLLNADSLLSGNPSSPDHQTVLLIGDEDNKVVFKWRLRDAMFKSGSWQHRVHLHRAQAGPMLTVCLFSLDWVGLDIHTQYNPVYSNTLQVPLDVEIKPKLPSLKAEPKAREKKRMEKQSEVKGKHPVSSIQQELGVMRKRLELFQNVNICHKRSLSTEPEHDAKTYDKNYKISSHDFPQILEESSHGNMCPDQSLRPADAVECRTVKESNFHKNVNFDVTSWKKLQVKEPCAKGDSHHDVTVSAQCFPMNAPKAKTVAVLNSVNEPSASNFKTNPVHPKVSFDTIPVNLMHLFINSKNSDRHHNTLASRVESDNADVHHNSTLASRGSDNSGMHHNSTFTSRLGSDNSGMHHNSTVASRVESDNSGMHHNSTVASRVESDNSDVHHNSTVASRGFDNSCMHHNSTLASRVESYNSGVHYNSTFASRGSDKSSMQHNSTFTSRSDNSVGDSYSPVYAPHSGIYSRDTNRNPFLINTQLSISMTSCAGRRTDDLEPPAKRRFIDAALPPMKIISETTIRNQDVQPLKGSALIIGKSINSVQPSITKISSAVAGVQSPIAGKSVPVGRAVTIQTLTAGSDVTPESTVGRQVSMLDPARTIQAQTFWPDSSMSTNARMNMLSLQKCPDENQKVDTVKSTLDSNLNRHRLKAGGSGWDALNIFLEQKTGFEADSTHTPLKQ